MRHLPSVLVVVASLACSKPAETAHPQTAAEALADAEGAKTLPPEKYVSTIGGFDLTIPGTFTGHYRTEERKDTTAGARFAVEFKFHPDSGSKAPSFTLMTLRIFTRTAWDKVVKSATVVGAELGRRGDDVFVISLPHENPYPPGSAEAATFDRMIISTSQGGQHVHITPHAAQ